jgi:hypothetical protein
VCSGGGDVPTSSGAGMLASVSVCVCVGAWIVERTVAVPLAGWGALFQGGARCGVRRGCTVWSEQLTSFV